ncbi:MAG: hypothetical protein JWN14_421 [Chthonomonadales bacterium]|nr:hypothetical protein [Chthonomonadales bacterium]
MNRTTWIVQDSLHPTAGNSTLSALERACDEAGCALIRVHVTPFSTEVPAIPPVSAPFVFYGYTTLITNAACSPQWKSGVFFDADLFQPSIYAQRYGDLSLNPDTRTLTCEAFRAESHPRETRFFVRPDNDLKTWTGQVMTFGEYLNRFEDFDESTRRELIAVSSPKEVHAEWRVVLVDSQPIASAQYQPQALAWVPAEVEAFARSAAAKWLPFPVVVMDIASTDNGLKVIELNCFNGSNFYLMDVGRIVRNVSRYLEAVTPSSNVEEPT